MKKKRNKDVHLENILPIFDISILNDLLNMEYNIEQKKRTGERLTDEEYFYDTYMLKPSILLKCIYKKNKDRN